MAPLPYPDRLARRDGARRRRGRRRAAVLGAGALLLAGLLALATGGSVAPRRPRPPLRPAVASRSRRRHRRARPPLVQLGAIPPARPGFARVFFHGPARGREIALTFDDGFCRACVQRIVAVLRRTGAHASFFPNGTYAHAWDPQAVRIRTLIERGQLTIGNHTFHHVDARRVGAATFAADLRENERWIERTFGVTARPFMRPPYGAYDGGALAVAGAQGYTRVVMWNGTVADSDLRTRAYLLNAIRHWARPGAIILMHANFPPTARALPAILALVRRMRLRPVTIGELLGGSPYGPRRRRAARPRARA